jgi:DNA-binding NarL/FixJ family response regulator
MPAVILVVDDRERCADEIAAVLGTHFNKSRVLHAVTLAGAAQVAAQEADLELAFVDILADATDLDDCDRYGEKAITGPRVIEALRTAVPAIRIAAMSYETSPVVVYAARRAGAEVFWHKDDDESLQKAAVCAHGRGRFVSSVCLRAWDACDFYDRLDEEERMVLLGHLEGHKHDDIAKALLRAEVTIRRTLKGLMTKLGVGDPVALRSLARRVNLDELLDHRDGVVWRNALPR